jgi:hypothetical protein
MKLTNKQQLDIDTVKHFIPSNVKFKDLSDEDIERYFDWSDRGIDKQVIVTEAMQSDSGIASLYWGKQRRDLQVTSYIEDWGSYITSVDFIEEPRFLVEWLSKVMKKPGILDMWKLFNDPKSINHDEIRRLYSSFEVFACA